MPRSVKKIFKNLLIFFLKNGALESIISIQFRLKINAYIFLSKSIQNMNIVWHLHKGSETVKQYAEAYAVPERSAGIFKNFTGALISRKYCVAIYGS